MCMELEAGFAGAKKKFSGVLAYFGEEDGMSSTDFFTTLHKFVLVRSFLRFTVHCEIDCVKRNCCVGSFTHEAHRRTQFWEIVSVLMFVVRMWVISVP